MNFKHTMKTAIKSTMTRNLKASLCLLAVILSLAGCRSVTEVSSDAAYANFKPQCLGVGMDGTQTLRVFGKGKDKGRAIEQAKKNAISEVIFNGIQGSGECEKRPLVNEVNARERYEDYFNAFFADGGAYKKYVKLDENRTSRIKAQSDDLVQYGVTVSVDRAALKSRLQNDGILPQ